jgi:hypothetical protein
MGYLRKKNKKNIGIIIGMADHMNKEYEAPAVITYSEDKITELL